MLVEDFLGWIKTIDASGRLRYLGGARNKLRFELTGAANSHTRLAPIETAVVAPNGARTAIKPHPFRPTGPAHRLRSVVGRTSIATRFSYTHLCFSSLRGPPSSTMS